MSKINLIKQELQKSTYADLVTAQDYTQLADVLNQKPLIDNPEPQSDIYQPVTILELFQAVTSAEGLNIYQAGIKPDIDHAVETKARNNLLALLEIAKQLISEESATNIENLMARTIPDPSYQSQILGRSIAEVGGYFPVTNSDIQAALND